MVGFAARPMLRGGLWWPSTRNSGEGSILKIRREVEAAQAVEAAMVTAMGSDVSAVRACLSSRTASDPNIFHVAWAAWGLSWSRAAPTKAKESVGGDFSSVAGREVRGRNKR